MRFTLKTNSKFNPKSPKLFFNNLKGKKPFYRVKKFPEEIKLSESKKA